MINECPNCKLPKVLCHCANIEKAQEGAKSIFPFHVSTYAHNWGILIPCKSGVYWEQQTGGVMCHHEEWEGIFIPLSNPEDVVDGKRINYLHLLEDANYTGDYKKAKEIWKKIKEVMYFDFEILDYSYEEGYMWVKFTKFEGHGEWAKKFIGKEVILIYPNCD